MLNTKTHTDMSYTLENSMTTQPDDRRSAVEVEKEYLQELRDKCPENGKATLWDCVEFSHGLSAFELDALGSNFKNAVTLGKLLIEAYGANYCDMLDRPCRMAGDETTETAAYIKCDGSASKAIYFSVNDGNINIKSISLVSINGLTQDEIVNALNA